MKDKTGLIMSIAGVILGAFGIEMWFWSSSRFFKGTYDQAYFMCGCGVLTIIGGLILLILGIYKIYINNKNK